MFDLVRNILSSPFWAIGATVTLWIVLFFLFTFFKLSDTNWKRLEYIWLFIGFLGVLAIVDENNKDFKEQESRFIKERIQFDISHLKFYLGEPQACFKYSNEPYSPDDFDLRQYDQDQICTWSKQFKLNIDTSEGIPINLLDTLGLRAIKFKTSFMDNYVQEFISITNILNANISKFNDYSSEIKSNYWKNFSRFLAPILLILAFAIRLAITTRNVRQTKYKSFEITPQAKS